MKDGSAAKRIAILVVLLSFVFVFAGCASKPSEAQGEKVLVNELASSKAVKVDAFRKTNGLEKTVDGVKKYDMAFEVDIEYVKKAFPIGGGLIGAFLSPPVPAGTKQTLKGTIEFTKTEKGWIGETDVADLVAVRKK